MRIFTVLAALVLGAAASGEAFAWGAEGHEYTGAVADRLLNDNARHQVQSILGFSLQTASTWADCVRSVHKTKSGQFVFTEDPKHPEYTAACTAFLAPQERARMEDYAKRNWDNCEHRKDHGCHENYHFADVAELHGRYDRRFAGTSDHDVVSAINAAVAVLQGRPAPAPFSIRDGKEALFLIAHFVGDLHQPLHVGAIYLTRDGAEVDPDAPDAADPETTTTHGGNSIVHEKTTLHKDWDAIPKGLSAEPSDAAVSAARQVPRSGAALGDLAGTWASETVIASRDAFAGLSFHGSGEHPPFLWFAEFADRQDYLGRKRDLQNTQLIRGGAHLAELLNAIWP